MFYLDYLQKHCQCLGNIFYENLSKILIMSTAVFKFSCQLYQHVKGLEHTTLSHAFMP